MARIDLRHVLKRQKLTKRNTGVGGLDILTLRGRVEHERGKSPTGDRRREQAVCLD